MIDRICGSAGDFDRDDLFEGNNRLHSENLISNDWKTVEEQNPAIEGRVVFDLETNGSAEGCDEAL